jgi:dienelactone hydrolase
MFDFFLKAGRAVMHPIYKGTYERSAGMDLLHFRPHGTHRYVEYLAMWVKDARRSIDYLETRSDIDSEKLAFAGFSWGGYQANVIPAVEDRLKVNLAVLGGFSVTPEYLKEPFPEADLLNYAPRVKMPTLMLNGRYDLIIPYETNAKPMFDFLGTPDEDKVQIVYETDHSFPRNEMIRECLDFLDRYLGPVTFN